MAKISPAPPESAPGPVAAPRPSASSLSSMEAPVDMEAIYKSAGIPAAPVTVEQILEIRDEMIRGGIPRDEVPRTLPVMVKLRFSEKKISIEEITASTSRKMSAL